MSKSPFTACVARRGVPNRLLLVVLLLLSPSCSAPRWLGWLAALDGGEMAGGSSHARGVSGGEGWLYPMLTNLLLLLLLLKSFLMPLLPFSWSAAAGATAAASSRSRQLVVIRNKQLHGEQWCWPAGDIKAQCYRRKANTYSHAHVHTHEHTNTNTNTHMNTHALTHAHTRTHTHTHTHAHTHMQTNNKAQLYSPAGEQKCKQQEDQEEAHQHKDGPREPACSRPSF